MVRIPYGVHGRNAVPPVKRRPAFMGWKPSTSLAGSIASITFDSSICSGRGSWTRIPWTVSSALSRATRSSSSDSGVDAGRSIWRESNPASEAAFPLLRTYTWDAGSSPTRTTVRPGRTPVRAMSSAARSLTPARTDAAMAFPSISFAVIGGPPVFLKSLLSTPTPWGGAIPEDQIAERRLGIPIMNTETDPSRFRKPHRLPDPVLAASPRRAGLRSWREI